MAFEVAKVCGTVNHRSGVKEFIRELGIHRKNFDSTSTTKVPSTLRIMWPTIRGPRTSRGDTTGSARG